MARRFVGKQNNGGTGVQGPRPVMSRPTGPRAPAVTQGKVLSRHNQPQSPAQHLGSIDLISSLIPPLTQIHCVSQSSSTAHILGGV
ncbi:unnamed protein product [Gadus morhua 'NCC']